MKGKFKNYGLWVSMASALVMLLQAFGLKFDAPYVNEIITGVLGVLVACGIISNPSEGSGYTDKMPSETRLEKAKQEKVSTKQKFEKGDDEQVLQDVLENDQK